MATKMPSAMKPLPPRTTSRMGLRSSMAMDTPETT